MFKIIYLRLENFRQYRGVHEVYFSSGLNLIQGHNDAGKSGMLLAMLFALYKYMGGNRSAIGFISDGLTRMSVTLDYQNAHTGKIYRVTRTVTDKKYGFTFSEKINDEFHVLLSSADKSSENDLVNKIAETTRINKNGFISLAYTEQKTFYQIVRGGAGVRKMLDGLLGIDASNVLRELVTEIIKENSVDETSKKELEERINDIKNDIAEIERRLTKKRNELKIITGKLKKQDSRLMSYNKVIKKIESLMTDFEVFVSKDDEIKSLISVVSNVYQKQLKEIIKEHGSEKQMSKRMEEIKREIDDLDAYLNSARKRLDGLKIELGGISSDKQRIQEELNEFARLKAGAKCPTCARVVPKIHLEKHVKELREKSNSINAAHDRIQTEINELSMTIEAKSKSREELSLEHSRIVGIVDNIERIKADIKKQRKKISESIMAFKNSVMDFFNNKFTTLLAELNESVADNNELMDVIKNISSDDAVSIMSACEKIRTENPDYKKHVVPVIMELFGGELMSSIKMALNECESHKDIIERDLIEKKARLSPLSIEIRELNSDKDKRSILLRGLSDRLAKINDILKRMSYWKANQSMMNVITEKVRKVKLEVLAKKTFEMYERLISRSFYKDMKISEGDYSLLVKSKNGIVDEFFPAKVRAGGGNETIMALSERIALVQLLGYNGVLMFDEPTDATDSDNLNTLVEGILSINDDFQQIFLITHHGIALEHARNTISLLYDEERNSTIIN